MILLSSGASNKVSQARPCQVSIGAFALAQCVVSSIYCRPAARRSSKFSRARSPLPRVPVSAMMPGPNDLSAPAVADDLSSLPDAATRPRRGSRASGSKKRSRSRSKPRPCVHVPSQECSFLCGHNSDEPDPAQPTFPDGSKRFLKWGARGGARQARLPVLPEGDG